MKVDPGTIMIPKAYSNPTTDRSSKTAGGSSIKAGKGDSVTFSSTTKKLQKISAAMDAPQASRADKIEALKNAIERGEYQIDVDNIADSMVNSFIPEA